MRKTLSALLKEVRACFDRIEDPIRGLNQTDCLGLAVFGMKCLLKFDEAAHYNEAVLSSDAVRCRSRAVGHARTARRSRGNCGIVSRSCSRFCSVERNWKDILTGITFFRSTEPDIFRRTRCTVKTAAKNTVAPLPTIMLGAVLVRRKEVFPFGEGRRKKERLRGGDAASRRRASRTSTPEAGGGRAGLEWTAYQSSQGIGPTLHIGSEARRSQIFGGSTAHRPWNIESSRMRTIYGTNSGTGSL